MALNRNAGGTWMAVGQDPISWGWGVRAPSRLSVPLPTNAHSLSIRWGLDRLARDGRVAQGRLWLRSTGEDGTVERELMKTGNQGSDVPHAGRSESVFPQEGLPAELVFDVRPVEPSPIESVANYWDWLEPVLRLEAGGRRREGSR
jgi:hypothetical protein